MKASKRDYVKVWKLAFFYFAISLTGLLSLSGCNTEKKPSFIIVALEHLSFNSFSCVDDRAALNSGLDTLCKEALRFTHAYTTSTQPAAALGSLLTGSYPYVHGLHRSNGRIKSKYKLLSELAEAQGYRTAFLSSSPSIMKKTGLSKGFDIFDDVTFLDKKNFLTPFKRQAEMLLQWLANNEQPFLAVIYNSELQSLSDAEADSTTFEKLDENLSVFFNELKSKGLWETSYVVVLGTQGESDYSRVDETHISNLHSENTNISMFVKPPRQKGDDGMKWKVDTFVNTADLGWSLMKTIDSGFLKSTEDIFPQLDFSDLWKKNSMAPNSVERKLLVEATNPWADGIETRYAVLQGNLVYIEAQTDQLFNSLNDGLETIDISISATTSQNDFKNENRKILSSIRANTNQNAWTHYKTDLDEWISANRDYWSEPNSRPEILENEINRYKKTRIKQPLTALLVQNLTTSNKLETLRQLGLKIDAQKSQAEKESFFEESRRQSLNLALENIWCLWGKNKSWIQSTVIKEYQ